MLSVRYGLCSHLSGRAHEEFQSKRVPFPKRKGGNTVLFPAGITVHRGMRSWLHAGLAGSEAASTNRASITTTAAVFEKVLTWLLEVFTQEVLVMVFVFLKMLCLNHQTISLGSLQSICFHRVLLVPAEAGDKVSLKDLCLASPQKL